MQSGGSWFAIMDKAAFFAVHSGLDREGPGEPADVHWALSLIAPPARVLDAGCGPGADLETLAQALPAAQITGIEKHPGFVSEARGRTAQFGERVRVSEGDMAKPGGPYDLIWCAGALYFLGVTAGLSGWKSALAPGAHVVFSEPVQLDPNNATAQTFWAEYPALQDHAGVRDQIAAAGYDVLGSRLIIGAPWERYYKSLQASIARLHVKGPTAPEQSAIEICQQEIDLWRACPDAIAYELFLTQLKK